METARVDLEDYSKCWRQRSVDNCPLGTVRYSLRTRSCRDLLDPEGGDEAGSPLFFS